jgi:AAA15 family ATPase/GTPase
MTDIIRKNAYRTFGLNVESEVFLPELQTILESEEKIDVQVEIGDLAELWKELSTEGNFITKPNMVLFRVPDTAIFLIQEGERVIVSPMKDSDENKIRLYILGTCMGAILMQRKILPLHGSAVAIDGKVYAIVGNSGAGKSTLASAFIKRGYQFLSDDVIAVSLSQDHGIPYIVPSYPQQKLWKESLNEFGMKIEEYQPLFERETKYAVPIQTEFSSKPLPLAGVFELNKTENNEIIIFPMSKLERLYKLYYHTYRQFLIPRLGLTEWHFNASSIISSQIEFFQINRPVSTFTANSLVDLILSTIHREVKV